MANQINLLPIELKTGKDVIKASRTITRIIVVFGVIFLIVAGIGGGFLFLTSRNSEVAHSHVEDLKNQIQFLEATEQKLVLVRDRIQKAQTVLELRGTYGNLKLYDEIVASLPANSRLVGFELDNEVSKITIDTTDSDDIATILKSLRNSNKYQVVELMNLSFNIYTGYEMILTIK